MSRTRVFTAQQKERMLETQRQRRADPVYRAKERAAANAKKTPETRALATARQRTRYATNPVYRERAKNYLRNNPEKQQAALEKQKELRKDPTVRAAEAAALRRRRQENPEMRARYNAGVSKNYRESCNSSVVYFIQGAAVIKIGRTTNVKYRLFNLRTHSPVAVSLLATTPGHKEVERQLHAHFAHLHSHGEWFHAAPELLAFIAALPGDVL